MTAAATTRMRRSLFRSEEPEWLVWALVFVMLAIGLIARTVVVNRTTTVTADNISVSYPVDWIALDTQAENEVVSAGQSFDAGLFPARFSLLQMPAIAISTRAQSLGDLALQWSNRGASDLLGYKVLNIEPMKVRGNDAVRVDYVYVADPALPTPNSIPVVAHGADILLRQGDNVLVVRFLADADAFDGLGAAWDRILGSLQVK